MISSVSPTARKIATLLLLWLGAYVTLVGIFTLFGQQLDSLPMPLRVLIVSAILVLVMTQIVIPLVARVTRRG